VPAEPGGSVRFGAQLELDARAWELRRAGVPVRLERIPMQILLLLVEQHGQLVSRESIVERVWGPSASFDTANSINSAMRKIRAALGDDPDHPQYIQTVTGCGYRFIAPVSETPPPPAATLSSGIAAAAATGPATAAPAASPPAAPAARPVSAATPATAGSAALPAPRAAAPRGARGRWLLGALGLTVLAAEIAWFVHWSHPGAPAPRAVMLAVLPLSNLTGDSAQEYLADGLTEELITQLGNSDPTHLGVIARTSVMRYKNTNDSAADIGKALNAQYLLEGSVRRDGELVRVTTQLVRANDQAHVWAREYDRTVTSVLTLQAEIARAVARELGGSLHPAEARVAQSAPPSPAYDLYLQGRYDWNKRTEQGFQEALKYFQQAIEKDARYAPAYAGLADTYAMMSDYGLSPPREAMPEARAAALKALELEPNLAEGHTALALVSQDFDYDWESAEREFRRAIELNPNYATAHQWFAGCLAAQGRFPEALAESERALTLDPLSPIVRADHAVILHFSRQDVRAVETFQSVLAMDPANGRAHMVIQTMVQQGRFGDALKLIEQWRHVDPSPWQSAAEAYVYGRAGDAARAGLAIDEMERATQNRGWDPLPMRAVAYLGVGDKERLLATLEEAYVQRANFITALKVDPAYDPVRDDPRFKDIVQRVGMH
jgi:TolB-like protein/DNA-binding winged helix-turn-helix (wHTH) protein